MTKQLIIIYLNNLLQYDRQTSSKIAICKGFSLVAKITNSSLNQLAPDWKPSAELCDGMGELNVTGKEEAHD